MRHYILMFSMDKDVSIVGIDLYLVYNTSQLHSQLVVQSSLFFLHSGRFHDIITTLVTNICLWVSFLKNEFVPSIRNYISISHLYFPLPKSGSSFTGTFLRRFSSSSLSSGTANSLSFSRTLSEAKSLDICSTTSDSVTGPSREGSLEERGGAL